jgi:hypothetical protein
MKKENENYDKVLNLLKKFSPQLDSTKEIEDAVLRQIMAKKRKSYNLSDIIDYLFGWIYIGWVRNSLIAASVALVVVFIYQQGIIIRQINYLSSNLEKASAGGIINTRGDFDRELLTLRLTGGRFRSGNISVSKAKMDALLESVNDLNKKYNDLFYLIEKDPELKEIIEKKLNEVNNEKTKI